MNRELWFRILQVTVVAPWIYSVSERTGTNTYFRVGLKLVAGTVIALNVPPLFVAYEQYKLAYANVIEGQATEVLTVPKEVAA